MADCPRSSRSSPKFLSAPSTVAAVSLEQTAPANTMPTRPHEPKESDLLVPFEAENIPADYKEYYKTKRNNFFASIQRFREMWKYYILLDALWLRELSDLQHPGHVH